MALAIHFDQLIPYGVVADYAEIARLTHVSRARISKIMNLFFLAPDIQEEILFLPRLEKGREPFYLAQFLAIGLELDWRAQDKRWYCFKAREGNRKLERNTHRSR